MRETAAVGEAHTALAARLSSLPPTLAAYNVTSDAWEKIKTHESALRGLALDIEAKEAEEVHYFVFFRIL